MNERPSGRRWLRPGPLIAAVVVIIAVLLTARFVFHRRPKAMEIPVEQVGRRSIEQTVQATGTVQPVETTEIRSKASGQILRMPVQIGSVVHTGDLLAQIDTVNVENQYREAAAAVAAARANVTITKAQKARADELFSQEVMTADQHEAAVLAYANAQSQLANAEGSLSNAKQALVDVEVRAPYDGTIIEQDVTKGQVIASATQSPSGGTLLFKMADLNRVQMQALVGETDVGNVRAGMTATVTVDAFPNRPFRGQVEKIEPQAVIQQSVTMFPVLISISNENGLLLPGMNGEVTISIARANDVLAVPLDAVRTMREMPAVAAALGMNADSVRAQVQREAMAARAAADSAGGRAGRDAAGADSARARGAWAARGASGQGGGRGFGAGAGQNAQAGGRSGAGRGSFAGAGRSGGFGGGLFGGSYAAGGAGSGGGNGRGQMQVTFVQTADGFEPRVVRLGVSDFDYAQVLSGLKEGDEVALLSVAEIQAKRQQQQQQIRQRMGGAMPGTGTGTGGGGRSSGGTRGGGGGPPP
ncbi:MAG TPA: efflux RND transporter periplasmic adaptor subunit [Terriglobales bacterium]|nr:efflux RND transporter periplasmic adaptor subunit [Terriglobales bacterium]